MIVKLIDSERDAADLTFLASRHHEELEPNVPFDQMFTYFTALDIANNKEVQGNKAWVCYRDDAPLLPVGYMVASIMPYFFSKKLCAHQDIWYVLPEHRSSRAAYSMFSAFEDYARDAKCIEVIGSVSMHDVDLSDKIATLFPRMGFKRTGSVFTKLIEE